MKSEKDPRELAMRLLARKPLTERELREQLEQRGYRAAVVDRTCKSLLGERYLDDRRLAVDFILARAERLGHAPQRLVEDLVRRGVSRETADEALRGAEDDGDVSAGDLLERQVQKRIGDAATLDARGYRRVYNALRRAGFDHDAIRRRLQPMLQNSDVDASYDDLDPSSDHDLP